MEKHAKLSDSTQPYKTAVRNCSVETSVGFAMGNEIMLMKSGSRIKQLMKPHKIQQWKKKRISTEHFLC